MTRAARLLVVFLWVALGVSSPAWGDTRVALVIGNGDYRNVPILQNPRNDAEDIARLFGQIGFDVTLAFNQTREQMVRTLADFEGKVRGADIAVLFFAGHGIEVDSRNYLIPVDAELARDSLVALEAIPLQHALTVVEGARRLSLVMLDACRDNPFANRMRSSGATRSIGRGLARVEPLNNSIVSYAAREGMTAADGDGRNSPYTTALLSHLGAPGVEVGFMFRKVRNAVMEATSRAQEPFIYQSLGSEPVYLVPPGDDRDDDPPPQPPTGTSDIDRETEIAFWRSVQDADDPAMYEAYLDTYPDGAFVRLARLRIAALTSPGERKVPDAPVVPDAPEPEPALPAGLPLVSVADIAAQTLGGVVMVRATASADVQKPLDLPEDISFAEFFERLGNANRDAPAGRPVRSIGSGFIADADGSVVTAASVVAGAESLTVAFADGAEVEARLVGADEFSDIAVLAIEPAVLPGPVLDFAGHSLAAGADALVIGAPLGLAGSVTGGRITGRRTPTDVAEFDLMALDANAFDGHAGGPVVDTEGKVAGVFAAILDNDGDRTGLAVPAEVAAEAVRQIRAGTGVTDRGAILRAAASASDPPEPVRRMFRDPDEIAVSVAHRRASVVEIAVRRGEEVQTGAGVVRSAAGLILTTDSLIEGADGITVTDSAGRDYAAEIVGTDARTNVALVRTTMRGGFTEAPLADATPRVGDAVFAFAADGIDLGVVSAVDRNLNIGPFDQYLQTDLTPRREDDGAPLFDLGGRVVGIRHLRLGSATADAGFGVAVSLDMLRPVIADLADYGEVRRGWLGVRIQPVTDDIAEALGRPDTSGTIVSGAIADGPAQRAGMLAGDVIVAFDGEPVAELLELPRLVAATAAGTVVPVDVWRGGDTLTLDVTIGRLGDPAASDPAPDIGVPAAAGIGGGMGAGDVMQRGSLIVTPASALTARVFDHDPGADGVVIAYVVPGSDAAEKGVTAGDVILRVHAAGPAVELTPDDASTPVLLHVLYASSGSPGFVTVAADDFIGRGATDYASAARSLDGEEAADLAAALWLAGYRTGEDAAVSQLEERADALPAATRAAIQAGLAEKGHYTGTVDGDFGPATRRALAAFARN